jgi:hypothetical protein
MNPQNEKRLEQLVHQTLRDLPSRRAPFSLEARVQAEIARRAALPWWRKSFAYWPSAARATFLVASSAVAASLVLGLLRLSAGLTTMHLKVLFAAQLRWLQTGSNLLDSFGEIARTCLTSIPSVWLYGAAAVVAALYVTLFGVSAAAYRTLYANS